MNEDYSITIIKISSYFIDHDVIEVFSEFEMIWKEKPNPT